MKQIQIDQPVELHTLTPELGIFVITGSLQDVEAVQDSFEGSRTVSSSTFDRVAYGAPARKRRKHLIELALF